MSDQDISSASCTPYRADQVGHRSGATGISTCQETCHVCGVGDSLNSELRGATNARSKVVEEERPNSLGITNVALLAGSASVDHLQARLGKDQHMKKGVSYAYWSTSSAIGQLIVAAGGVLALLERCVLGRGRQREACRGDSESNGSDLHGWLSESIDSD